MPNFAETAMDETSPVRDDEIGLLDLVVVIAESWKLLFVVPFLAGALAYFGLNMITTSSYTSQALVRMDVQDAALLQSARVLDVPIQQSSWLSDYENSLTRARTAMIEALDVQPVEGTGFYRIGVSHRSAEGARELLTLILDALIANSQPVGSEARRLASLLEIRRETLDTLNVSLTRLSRFYETQPTTTDGVALLQGDVGQSIVELISNIQAARQFIADTEQRLEGRIQPDDIVQRPTLPDSAEGRGLLIAVALVVIATGFLMLIGVFGREGFRRASKNANEAAKVDRIRRAFWLPPRHASPSSDDA